VLGFALLISLATGLLFGLAPHSFLEGGTCGTVREGSRGSGYSAKAGRMRDALMVSQLAFAVVLMIGAGSYWKRCAICCGRIRASIHRKW